MTVADTDVDLSDLDLLDEEHAHARCTLCEPRTLSFGAVYVALCGRRVLFRAALPPWVIPANACPDCVRLIDQPCTRCGASP